MIRSKLLIFFGTLFVLDLSIFSLIADSSDNINKGSVDVAPVFRYKIVNSFPHDPEASTQGLVYEDGVLYEGTGLRGRSSLRKVELETGYILQNHDLPEKYFGEGLTIFDDKIIQLTWRSRVGFVYDKKSFKLVKKFNYSTEGWGLTHDGKSLIMSDGTDNLYFLDPETFEEIKRVKVFDKNGPVNRLNELEYVKGEILANVWLSNRIARISPENGEILGWIDLKGILGKVDGKKNAKVLNGIAFDEENDRLFVTGKLWPKIFEIKLVKN
ncbi:glutaminyl-peptide cyclotransferase [Desulfobacterota bacterium AH_259_B03_O07]|nr:glutaminyl-peptide cyclotransferase [Desulfobacterota bacterium AH_259_B03_O07]